MEDQSHNHRTTTRQPASAKQARSRWMPMSEHIQLMESIFNGGTVNPSKDEITSIRCLLEEFGPISDTNIFFWFQNRRSRFRRQRHFQATANSLQPPFTSLGDRGAGVLHHPHYYTPVDLGLYNINNNLISLGGGGVDCQLTSSSLCGGFAPPAADDVDVFLTPTIRLSDHNPTFGGGGGVITVFVNGVATQVPTGSFDIKAVFGEDVVLFHSTGTPVPADDFGFCFHGLIHGETYFLL